MKERKLNRKEKFYSEYCSGCGLCKAAQDVQYVDKASKGTSKIKLVRTVIGTVKRIIKGSI